MPLEDIQFPESKCPMCDSYYEDAGAEQIRGKFLITFCSNCSYIFEVE